MLHLEESRRVLIQGLLDLVNKRLSPDDAKIISNFIEIYYIGVSPRDLEGKSALDLFEALMSHWHFIKVRNENENKVRILNPTLEEQGFESLHTIIEIICTDMPFVLDSLRMALNRLNCGIHLIISTGGISFERDQNGNATKVVHTSPNEIGEYPIYIEIEKETCKEELDTICAVLINVLEDVRVVVHDWQPMRQKLSECIDEITVTLKDMAENDPVFIEHLEFLQWISNDNFTFLGYSQFEIGVKRDKGKFIQDTNSSLGLLTKRNHQEERHIDYMCAEARESYEDSSILLIGKTNSQSTVHRPAYIDSVVFKIFKKGKLIGEHQFLGLYTSVAYNANPKDIPIVRHKIKEVIKRSGFPQNSHDSKALLNIIENLPREDLFYSHSDDLFFWSMGILHLQDRKRVKLFMRKDVYGKYYSCLVFVPRDTFNSALREKFQEIIMNAVGGISVTFFTKFSESVLARVHYIIRIPSTSNEIINPDYLERMLIEAGREWEDDFTVAMLDHFGEEKAIALFAKYQKSFPLGYKEIFTPRAAVADIEQLEDIPDDLDTLNMNMYRPIENTEDSFRFKLYRRLKQIELSNVVPILENLGLALISERPYNLKCKDGSIYWLNDYRMRPPEHADVNFSNIKEIFSEAFNAVWNGKCEDDKFNHLVLQANLTWKEISLLRAYFKYMWQTNSTYSQNYVEEALVGNVKIVKILISYFYEKFSPDKSNDQKKLESFEKEFLAELNNVVSLNEDRILRFYLGVIKATVRTNFFQNQTRHKPTIAFKFASSLVPNLPLPRPMYEIFVYSVQMEGIHLRSSNVARGGLRWSDRLDDFRTEVLGLVKAQQVKNAVIVPWGAKGGFVVKKPVLKDRKLWQQEGISAYKDFISSLLDITDNRVKGEVIKPDKTVCWDEDDPYFVVAADKGTATFSDIANEISQNYNFWLGDAFASGGSYGYDHKKMGITARGAFESVKIHFLSLGIDVMEQEFSVVAIGDMGGDVFGNGMLLSPKIQLKAAFNHLHIFLDPSPDCEISYKERQRLFTADKSGWKEYDQKLISQGGGVFDRSAKIIDLSPQVMKMLNTELSSMTPNELIRELLKLDVDLFWNGGIGTFAKSKSEEHSRVGDRANDIIRLNGNDFGAKVIGEGGNLGFTQLGRIEYAQKGGIINTDAIDNSAGVNCSDQEVNIKIMLNEMVANGDITEKYRNTLMSEMSDEVSELVLTNNRKQNRAITNALNDPAKNFKMQYRLMIELERNAGLDLAVEFLPDRDESVRRINSQQGFTRPEIAVLLAYTKMYLKRKILTSELPEDDFSTDYLFRYFPKILKKKYRDNILNHRLRREIIATQLSNAVVDEMGINFIHRLQDETGACVQDIVKSYLVAKEVFNADSLRLQIVEQEKNISVGVAQKMMHELNRLIRRASRWFIRNHHRNININEIINQFKDKIDIIFKILPDVTFGNSKDHIERVQDDYQNLGVPNELAEKVSSFALMFAALDIVDAVNKHEFSLTDFAKVYFAAGARLHLGWFREIIKHQEVSSHFEALARASFRDDVDRQQRNITIGFLLQNPTIQSDVTNYVQEMLYKHDNLLKRWEYFVSEIKSVVPEFTMFAVALRELLDLSEAISHTRNS